MNISRWDGFNCSRRNNVAGCFGGGEYPYTRNRRTLNEIGNEKIYLLARGTQSREMSSSVCGILSTNTSGTRPRLPSGKMSNAMCCRDVDPNFSFPFDIGLVRRVFSETICVISDPIQRSLIRTAAAQDPTVRYLLSRKLGLHSKFRLEPFLSIGKTETRRGDLHFTYGKGSFSRYFHSNRFIYCHGCSHRFSDRRVMDKA